MKYGKSSNPIKLFDIFTNFLFTFHQTFPVSPASLLVKQQMNELQDNARPFIHTYVFLFDAFCHNFLSVFHLEGKHKPTFFVCSLP